MFVAGPPVVSGLGEDLNKQELGGWKIQLAAGGVDDATDTEEEAFQRAKQWVKELQRQVPGGTQDNVKLSLASLWNPFVKEREYDSEGFQ